MVKNRVFAAVWRALGLALGVMGLTFQIVGTSGFMGGSMLVFFTNQTNIFSTALFAVLFVLTIIQCKKQGLKGEIAHVNLSLQLAFTYFITITFLVYWLLLSWSLGDAAAGGSILGTVSNYIVHGVVPLWAIADFVMFMPHGRLEKRFAAYWLAYPLAYYLFTIIRAQFGAPLYTMGDVEMMYPYPFIEPQILGGVGMVIPVFFALLFAFWALGYLYIKIDKRIAIALLSKGTVRYSRLEKVEAGSENCNETGACTACQGCSGCCGGSAVEGNENGCEEAIGGEGYYDILPDGYTADEQ